MRVILASIHEGFRCLLTRFQLFHERTQFLGGQSLPTELIVRDRRFTQKEIKRMCEDVGLKVIKAIYTRAGRWDIPLAESDDKAKEILVLCELSSK